MGAVEHVPVAVREDFVARQTPAKPIPALAELIWNSLDGDASNVEVEFERNDLAGGLSKIVVYGDGDGFPREDARSLFGNLGGSWKRAAAPDYSSSASIICTCFLRAKASKMR